MSAELDPYRDWLGVKSAQRPPTHYQLLDLSLYEANREKIETAEMIQMAKVLRHESGPHAELAARVSRELQEAVRCLLDPIDKAAYDADLFLRPEVRQTTAADSAAVSEVTGEPPIEHCEPASEEVAPPEASSQPAEAVEDRSSYNFAADLKLDEEEEVDDFSSDLKLPEPPRAPEPAPTPAPVAEIRPAPQRQEMETEFRPSFLDMLEPPAKGKDSASKAVSAEKKAAFYDPPPIEKKRALPALPHVALSVKQIAVLATVAAIVLAVWLRPRFYQSAPDPGSILAMLDASDPQTRIEGIYSLQSVELEPTDVSGRLLKILKEDQVDEVRVAAVQALVNHGVTPQQASGELKPLLTTEKHDTIKQLLQWLVEQSGGKP